MKKLVAVLAASVICSLQGAPAPKARKPFGSALNFDHEVKRLPSGFRGASILPLIDKLAPNGPPEKGEFESTSEYERRVERERFPFGRWIAAEIADPRTVELSYDADAETLSIRMAGTAVDAKDGRIVVGFVVNVHNENERQRVGQNAFGAKTVIRYSDETRIRVGSWADALVTGEEGVLKATLAVPRSRARAVRTTARSLLAFRTAPLPPGIGSRTIQAVEASFDSPYEGTFEDVLIFTQEAELWLYIPGTGEVLGKWPLTVPTAAPSPAPKE